MGASGGPFLPQAAATKATKTISHEDHDARFLTTKDAKFTKLRQILLRGRRVLRGLSSLRAFRYSTAACSIGTVAEMSASARPRTRPPPTAGRKRRTSSR